MPRVLVWGKEQIKKYKWLYKFLTDQKLKPEWLKLKRQLDEDNYINQISIHTLIKIIEKNQNWGNSSRQALFFMIARYLQINRPDDIDNIRILQQKGFDLKLITEEKDANNELDEKEKISWKELQYFRDILDNFNQDDIKNQRDHQKWLLLNLLVKQPPLRTSFYYTAKLAKSYDDIEEKKNYILLINQGRDKVYYVVGDDKVSNSKLYRQDDSLSYINIENRELVDIIYKSFEDYPRTYLFENDKKHISDKTLLTYLKEITQINGITMDMMRSSYITDFHKHNKRYIQHLKLSKQMRHTLNTSTLRYKKVTYEDENQIVNLKKKIEELEEENKKLKERIIELEK